MLCLAHAVTHRPLSLGIAPGTGHLIYEYKSGILTLGYTFGGFHLAQSDVDATPQVKTTAFATPRCLLGLPFRCFEPPLPTLNTNAKETTRGGLMHPHGVNVSPCDPRKRRSNTPGPDTKSRFHSNCRINGGLVGIWYKYIRRARTYVRIQQWYCHRNFAPSHGIQSHPSQGSFQPLPPISLPRRICVECLSNGV